MEYRFHLQDPTDPKTVYLYEAIIEAVQKARVWRCIFAFVTLEGVNSLLGDPVVRKYLDKNSLALIVGLDAVTTPQALERLLELKGEYATFDVKVFWNRTKYGIFHPKICHFETKDERQIVIVGSGNLTPGGLRGNFEAYSVFTWGPGSTVDLSPWNEFLTRHAPNLQDIDDRALEWAARNVIRRRRRRPDEAELEEEFPEEEPQGPEVTDRVLIATIPSAGGRWHQAHFNRGVIEEFFHVSPNSAQRVYLTQVRSDGSRGPQETRPCVYSRSNKNLKIELAARRDDDYPSGGPPIAVFRELHVRVFEYTMLFPGEDGYNEAMALLDRLPRVGKGLRRVISDVETVRQVWPGFQRF